MRLPQLLISQCPKCQSELKIEITEYKDEFQPDQFADQKFNKIIEKFGQQTLEQLIQEIQWNDGSQTLQNLMLYRIIYEGTLTCSHCQEKYAIKNRIPRFVKDQ